MPNTQFLNLSELSEKGTHPGVAEDSKHLTFEIGDWAFTIKSSRSSGVIRRAESGKCHEMPGMQEPLCGMINHMGNAIPVFNFGSSPKDAEQSKALVLLGHPPEQLAFWVANMPKSSKVPEKYEAFPLEHLSLPMEVRRIATGLWRKNVEAGSDAMTEWLIEMAEYDILVDRFGLEGK